MLLFKAVLLDFGEKHVKTFASVQTKGDVPLLRGSVHQNANLPSLANIVKSVSNVTKIFLQISTPVFLTIVDALIIRGHP